MLACIIVCDAQKYGGGKKCGKYAICRQNPEDVKKFSLKNALGDNSEGSIWDRTCIPGHVLYACAACHI